MSVNDIAYSATKILVSFFNLLLVVSTKAISEEKFRTPRSFRLIF
jgi:hypothetical protein